MVFLRMIGCLEWYIELGMCKMLMNLDFRSIIGLLIGILLKCSMDFL